MYYKWENIRKFYFFFLYVCIVLRIIGNQIQKMYINLLSQQRIFIGLLYFIQFFLNGGTQLLINVQNQVSKFLFISIKMLHWREKNKIYMWILFSFLTVRFAVQLRISTSECQIMKLRIFVDCILFTINTKKHDWKIQKCNV